MKKFLFTLILLNILPLGKAWLGISAQNQVEYYLPKTQLKFTLLVEKAVYTPGEFAIYSEHYLKKTQPLEGSTTYKLLGIQMQPVAIPDPDRHFAITIDGKHTVIEVERNQNGVLTAINCKAEPVKNNSSLFTLHSSLGAAINPHDFMSQEILSAGSTTKMAELTAHEIYDIRDSRNQLSRGEADFMPKDGEQLKIMMQNLDRQEHILLQTFEGTTVRDTSLVEVFFIPQPTDNDSTVNTEKSLLFRFSKYLGKVDNDNLAGAPFYISVTDLITMPELPTIGVQKKKDVPYLTFSMPGKIRVSVDSEDGKQWFNSELYAAQYGRIEQLPQSLFGKKMFTKVQVNPVSGYIDKITIEPIE